MILFISLHQILFLIPPGRSNVMSSFNVQHFSFAMVNEVQILLMLLQSSQLVMELCTTIARESLEPYMQLGLSILTGENLNRKQLSQVPLKQSLVSPSVWVVVVAHRFSSVSFHY
jgi:hypothetical protein